MSTKSLLIGAKRSPIAPINGALSALTIESLSSPVIAALLKEANVPHADVEELVVGNALGAGGNPARRIALAADLKEHVAGLTIDRQCVSGLDAIRLAAAMIDAGQADVIIAGGVESYSKRPWRAHRSLGEQAPNPDAFYEQAPFTPWPEHDPNMNVAANQLAQEQGYVRTQLDAWAIRSHERANAATQQGHLSVEIAPLSNLHHDPFTRHLTPAHTKRARTLEGAITVANTAPAADGAAFCLLVSHSYFERLQFKAKHSQRALELLGSATVGADFQRPGLAPIKAIAQSCLQANLKAHDFTHIELMEAYAVQALACIHGAQLEHEIVNQKGGALARGHPIGASGAVLMTRLFHDLKAKNDLGLAAIAAAGGLGSAIITRPIQT